MYYLFYISRSTQPNSRSFFDKYRDAGADSTKPVKFTDCARIYHECAAAEEFEQAETDTDEAAVQKPAEDEEQESSIANNDVVDYDKKTESVVAASDNDVGRSSSQNIGQLIMLRAEQ